jgi:hypothetical protein
MVRVSKVSVSSFNRLRQQQSRDPCCAGSPTKPVIARGQDFLIKTQREDGSWPMTSRPTKLGGEGSKSLIPITGAGSAWAVLGLVRSR